MYRKRRTVSWTIRQSSSPKASPRHNGTKGLVGDKLTEIEEKYDLTKGTEGFNVKEQDGTDAAEEETSEEEEEGGEEPGVEGEI
jgi:hypothetical protein